jgi:hypothetical protein
MFWQKSGANASGYVCSNFPRIFYLPLFAAIVFGSVTRRALSHSGGRRAGPHFCENKQKISRSCLFSAVKRFCVAREDGEKRTPDCDDGKLSGRSHLNNGRGMKTSAKRRNWRDGQSAHP